MISLQSVTYFFPNREVPALRNIDVEIKAGEFVLLTGDSGSGKSTLLRTMNGLVPHFSGGRISGTVTVNGLDVITNGPQQLSRHVGFVGQVPEDQTLMDVVEAEIAFPLENAAMQRELMHLRMDEVLDLLGLTQLRDRPIAALSGGERQRVAIASALGFRPQILILDEPTSQLDPETADAILRTLHRLSSDFGLTIVLAEHRLERVLPYVGSIAYMENGRLRYHGTVRQTLVHIPHLPPVASLAKALGWNPLPLTVREARRQVEEFGDPGYKDQTLPIPGLGQGDGRHSPLLQVNDLYYSYNQADWAIEAIDLQLERGEILALVGSNGSGKSTLLRAIVSLIGSHRGEILLDGRSIVGEKTVELARQIAYLPQNPDDLLFAETVRQEFEITLQNHGLAPGEAVRAMLAELDLASVADDYPRDLSTGQRQRVALGAITITRPRVILLDEPTRGLDGRNKDKLVEQWRGWREAGIGIVLATHDVELAAQIADRAIILDRGKVIASGPTREVLGNSLHFAPQMARLFPGRGWLTVPDAVHGLQKMSDSLL